MTELVFLLSSNSLSQYAKSDLYILNYISLLSIYFTVICIKQPILFSPNIFQMLNTCSRI